MRMLERNKQAFFYAVKTGEQAVMDGAYETGENVPTFGTPARGKASVSASKGEYKTGIFGNDDKYDKIIVYGNGSYPITETTVLWIDDTDISHQHDYEVYKIAKSLNVTSVAVRKVKINA